MFAIESVVADAAASIAVLAAGKNNTIDNTTADGGARTVLGDVHCVRQVLLNLLSNAIKYNHGNGSVRIWIEEGGSRTRVGINDSGAGLSPEQTRRLFQAFDRLGAERGSIEGAGIGLAISKRLVEAMGGAIGVDSVPGQGSSFWIELDRFPVPGAS